MRPKRFWLLLTGVLLLISIGASAWLTGSETGLVFLTRLAVGLSDGKLAVEGVHGALLGPLRIDRLNLMGEEKRYEFQGLRFDWMPSALAHGQLRVTLAELAELRISEIKPSTKPPQAPDSLRLPLGLSVPRVRVGSLVLQIAGREWRLKDIEFSLDKPTHTYRLDLRAAATPWGDLQAQASLQEIAPFGLAALARLRNPRGQLAASADGELARFKLKVSATLGQGHGDADALLSPFASHPVREAHLTARGFDPKVWDETLPSADLSLDAELRSEDDHAISGALTLRNARPGTWDAGRLPLRELSARLIGTREAMDLRDLHLDLARAGILSGGGRLDARGATFDLATRNLDPAGIHGKLRSLRLAGELHARLDPASQHLLADLGYQRYRLHLDMERRDRVLRIEEAMLSSGTGKLGVYGTLGLEAKPVFDLAGALSGFDPAAFGAYPSARINASFSARGQLAPTPEASVSFAIADSQFRRQPLTGQGNLNVTGQRVWDSDATLSLGSNRMDLRGAFGAPGDRLAVNLRVDRPELIHPGLGGRIRAEGRIAGNLAAPSGQIEIEAENLAWGDTYRLGELRAKATLAQGLAGELDLDARLSQLRAPAMAWERASVTAQGRRDRHTLTLAARNADMDFDAELAGAWREMEGKPGWSGQVRHLANRGGYPLELLAPAQLRFGTDHVQLSEARLAALGARFDVREAAYRPRSFSSRGEFTGLSFSAWEKWPGWPASLAGDLTLGGNWNIEVGEHFDGRIALARERGDLSLSIPAEAKAALGLQRLLFSAEARDGRIQASLEADGTNMGRLRASGASRLTRHETAWRIDGDAPIQADAELALKSVAWMAPFLADSATQRDLLRFDGKLDAQLRVDGSLADPRFVGSLAGEHFTLALPEQGLAFQDGRFQADLDGNALELKSLSLLGGDGTLSGSGRLALRDGAADMRLALKADKLLVASRPDRLLILSGGGDLALAGNTLRLNAKLTADRGLIELAGEDAPTLSDDVVVLGRKAVAPSASTSHAIAIAMDLDLNLGEKFFLKGHGLDAQLAGAVKLVGRPGTPLRANGGIRVVKGSYAAYGQRLAIERGILNFQGPLDNPGLNIVALRKNLDVEAGVAITGTAQAPVVKLVSTPSVGDGEKLSWLVLGHGLSETGTGEFDALQLAAGALLGAGESVTLQQRIAQATGLEEIGLKGSGNLESAVITLGKRLSSRAYLSYEQGLSGTETLVKINYTLTRRLSVRAQAGTTPALDVFYTFSFD